MEVQTPFLPCPIEVRGSAPYHVEHHGSVYLICDSNNINSVAFRFDYAEGASKSGVAVPAKQFERNPILTAMILRDDWPEHVDLCHSVANYLNQAEPRR